MEHQELMVDEHRRLELVAARKDTLGLCDCCQLAAGMTWFDSQWLCSECLTFFGQKLDAEGAAPAMAENRGKRRGIGGSDIPALCGLDAYQDPFAIAMRIRGELEPEPANERMLAGTFLQKGIADFYSYKTGRPHQWWDKTIRHKTLAWAEGRPDAFCTSEARGLDCKLVQLDQREVWRTGPAAPAVVQCQWYMLLTGIRRWDIAMMSGEQLEVYELEYDSELAEALLRIATTFWNRCVIGGEIPIIGTSAASERYLKQHYPRNKEELRRATPEEEKLLDLYSDIRTEHEQAEKARCQLENQLKEAVGDADGIYDRTRKFTWKNTRERVVCDWQKVAEKLMANLPAATREVLIAEHSEKQPGSRRIHWSEKAER